MKPRSPLRLFSFDLTLLTAFVICAPMVFANQPPIASFTRNPSEGNAPLTVAFDASASSDSGGSIVSYSWDFGDGHLATGLLTATTTHVYVSTGLYFSILTVIDNSGLTDSFTAGTLVTQLTPDVLTAGSVSGLPGGTVNLPLALTPSSDIGTAGLQFDLVLSSTLTAVAITTGPVADAAGKTIATNLTIPRAVIFGINLNSMGPGELAVAQLQIDPSATPGTYAVGLTNVVAASPFGDNVPISAAGGMVTVQAAGSPAITSISTDTDTAGQAYTYNITATNSPTSFNATGLPPGLSINMGTGAITGTPSTVGAYTITLTATNGSGSGTATLILTVNPAAGAPTITSAGTAKGVEGYSFFYTITASNSPTSYNATGLPPGLSVNMGTGDITGTATSSGTYTVIMSATNGSGPGTATLIITIDPSPAQITSILTATGYVGQAFSYTVTASNNPLAYNAAGLPAALVIQNVTGAITGTPTASGITDVTLTAINNSGNGPSSTLVLTILSASITSALSETAQVGQPFSYTITANFSATSFEAMGLPTGLTVDTTSGIISGTPATVGVYTINLSVVNGGLTANAVLTLTVSLTPPPPVITSPTSAQGTVGTAFSYQITATNNPTSYAATGLPSGLSVNTATGLISGTPTVAGVATVSLSATNSAGTGPASLTVTVANVAGSVPGGSTGPIHVFPNPWRADQHSGMPITFTNLQPNSDVKIFTTSGYWVGTIHADSTSVTWDLKNNNGTRVASGLYYYRIEDGQGSKITGELVVIR